MPLYGTTLPAPAEIFPGQTYKLFDGTETPAAGLKSVAFQARTNPGQPAAPRLFTVAFPSAPTATVTIQASNDDVEANYQAVGTVTTQHGYYTDYGNFAFYRLNLSTYSAGGMPTVIVNA